MPTISCDTLPPRPRPPRVEINRPPYRYHLTSTGHNSARFGACEVCGLHCTEVFIQAEMKFFQHSDVAGWTFHGCAKHRFGHEACLRSAQRGEPKPGTGEATGTGMERADVQHPVARTPTHAATT